MRSTSASGASCESSDSVAALSEVVPSPKSTSSMWYMSFAPYFRRRSSVSLGWMDVTMWVCRRARVIPRTNAWRPSRSERDPSCGVLRPDVVRPSLPREDVLAGAPSVEEDKFRVPRILTEEA